MGIVVSFERHARASAAAKPNKAGSGFLPTARKASDKTKKCSVGIRPRAFQLKGALCDLTPAIERAASGPPTASKTSSMVESISITHRDNSRSVSTSSPHVFDLDNPSKNGTIAGMYSKTATAKRLIQTQEALGLTNAAIAKELGVSSHGWSQYRTGDRTIPHTVIVGLKERFGIPADWILAGDASGLPQRIYAQIRAAA